MEWNKFRDAVNLGGSVASITGISLLWLNQLTPSVNLLALTPIVVIAALLSVGCVTLAVYLLRSGYQSFVQSATFSMKVVYWCFAGAAMIFFVSLALFMIFGFASIGIRDSQSMRF